MHLNTDLTGPEEPTRLPSLRDLATLTTTLLPPAVVMLIPLPELERRCQEIDLTHPQYREETPLVRRYEVQRREQLGGTLQVVAAPAPQVASSSAR